MSSAYDLSLSPDSRFLKFRADYTLAEHALSLHEQFDTHATTLSDALEHVARNQRDQQWAIESCFDVLADEIGGLRQEVREGFHGMAKLFNWGLERICWEHEQDRQLYRETIDVLRHPLRTQAEEHWEHACSDIENHRWEYAVDALCKTIEFHPRHYLAQFQLGHILFFRFGQSGPALHHFEQAALFADEVGADAEQQHWAALAYSHISLLQRLSVDVAANAHDDACLQKALEAARRAYSLSPTLPPALSEMVLTCLLLGKNEQAHRAMASAVAMDERLLLGLRNNGDLASFPEVAAFVAAWRSAVVHQGHVLADALSALRRLITANSLPDALARSVQAATNQAVRACASDTPRTTFHSCLSSVDDILTDAVNTMSARLAEARALVSACQRTSAQAALDWRNAETRLGVVQRSVAYPDWRNASGIGFGAAIVAFVAAAVLTLCLLRAPAELAVDFPGRGSLLPAHLEIANHGERDRAPDLAAIDVRGKLEYRWDRGTRPSSREVAEEVTDYLLAGGSGPACRRFRLHAPERTRFVKSLSLALAEAYGGLWSSGAPSFGLSNGTDEVRLEIQGDRTGYFAPGLYDLMQASGARWEVRYRPFYTSRAGLVTGSLRNGGAAFCLALALLIPILAKRSRVRKEAMRVAEMRTLEQYIAAVSQRWTAAEATSQQSVASLSKADADDAAFRSAFGSIRSTVASVRVAIDRLASLL